MRGSYIYRMNAIGSHRKRSRRGATVLEMAIILPLFLTLALGMLDLGIAVFRYHIITEAARQGTRQAIVHGSRSNEPWGPAAYSGTGNDAHPLVDALHELLFNSGLDLSQVTIQAEWPDAGNDPMEENRVQVSVSVPYHPIVTFIFGNPTYTLQATSTMIICH